MGKLALKQPIFVYSTNFHTNCRFIFLFRWTEERRARRKVVDNAAEIFVKDEEKVNSIFFAQQVGVLSSKYYIVALNSFLIYIWFISH